MIETLRNWFRRRSTGAAPPPRQAARRLAADTAQRATPGKGKAPQRRFNDVTPDGPGNHALIRNKFVREDTDTHETLKILDDSIVDSGEEPGLDPYNTGGFDRSRNWERRFGK